MIRPSLLRLGLRIGAILLTLYVLVLLLVYFLQRSMLYFPSHHAPSGGLAAWTDGGRALGFCREVVNPNAIWLMTHGNAGQAADRDYVLPCLSDRDSLYVVEYPGYGARPGSPCLESMNQAAAEAYQLLRARNPHTAVCVLGESIGTGPACALAREKTPPDKIVLVVPFDALAKVAARRFPFLPVRLLLRDAWNNVASLQGYKGTLEVFGAKEDAIIPVTHARALAHQVAGARFMEIEGGHNDWSRGGEVKIER